MKWPFVFLTDQMWPPGLFLLYPCDTREFLYDALKRRTLGSWPSRRPGFFSKFNTTSGLDWKAFNLAISWSLKLKILHLMYRHHEPCTCTLWTFFQQNRNETRSILWYHCHRVILPEVRFLLSHDLSCCERRQIMHTRSREKKLAEPIRHYIGRVSIKR